MIWNWINLNLNPKLITLFFHHLVTKLPYKITCLSLSTVTNSFLFFFPFATTPSLFLCKALIFIINLCWFSLFSIWVHRFSRFESVLNSGYSSLLKKIWFFIGFLRTLVYPAVFAAFRDLGLEEIAVLNRIWGNERGRILVRFVGTITSMKKGKFVGFAVIGFRLDQRKLAFPYVGDSAGVSLSWKLW